MRFFRRGDAGSEIPTVRDGDGDGDVEYDLRGLTSDIDGSFLAADGIARTRTALEHRELPIITLAPGVRYGSPIARPQAVVCIGQNYAAHAAESGSPVPEQPIIFFKHPNAIVGPYDPILLPRGSTRLDWEVELGVVIRSRASYIESPEAALTCVAGYITSNDVSEREFQIERSGGQWSKGKSARTFNPLGPALVPADEVDGQALRLWSTVNGEARQDSTTADMVFSIGQLVMDLSEYLVLEPGDLINTGTPQGVALSGRFPYLTVGDRVEVGIDGLGSQASVVVASLERGKSTA